MALNAVECLAERQRVSGRPVVDRPVEVVVGLFYCQYVLSMNSLIYVSDPSCETKTIYNCSAYPRR